MVPNRATHHIYENVECSFHLNGIIKNMLTRRQILLNFNNTSHPNISFKMEKRIDNKLPFLDILFDS